MASYTSNLRPHTLKFRLLICARGLLRGTFRMLPHTCRMRYVLCYLIRASYATYATSGVLLVAKSDYVCYPPYVPHTLRMLPQGYFSGPKVTYIREVGASDFVRCLIRYVCYLIRASCSTHATSYVSHMLISSVRPHTRVA